MDIKFKIQESQPTFAKEVDSLTVEQLKARMSENAGALADLAEKKEDDEELEKAAAKHSDLKSVYEKPKKEIMLRQRYLRLIIKEKEAASK